MRLLKLFISMLLSLIMSTVLSAFVLAANIPYNISITFNNDTKTEMNITWMTPVKGKQSLVEVWQDGHQPKIFHANVKIISSRDRYHMDETLMDDPKNVVIMNISSIIAIGLKPNTAYNFRCGDGTEENWSVTGRFYTGVESEDFQFLFMTDSQAYSDGSFAAWKSTGELARKRYPDARFCVLAGDLVDAGGSECLWNRFFSYGKNLLTNMTMVPAIGNHETDYGSHTFDSHFLFPKNKENMPDYVYSFDYGNVHFSILSTEMTVSDINNNELLNRQAEWLKRDVRKSNKKWNIVVLHKALYSTNYYLYEEDVTGIREKLAPIFDELSIDAVLQGHDHVFSRTFVYNHKTVAGLSKESQTVKKDNGTLYLLGNTAASKFCGFDEDTVYMNLLKYGQPGKSTYTGVTVSDDYLKFDTFINKNGTEDELYDTFTIFK